MTMGRHKRMTKKQPGSEVLGRQLRALRQERGLRLVDLGAATGLSHAFLSQVECGSAYPSLSTLWKIADALGVHPHHLKAMVAEGRLDATDPESHSGEEFVYVVEGVLEITLGNVRHRLEQGDSIVFDGSIPHGYETVGDGAARTLFVCTMQDAEGGRTDGGGNGRRRRLLRPEDSSLGGR
jgi:transcriptional regulator with XRE-family HTH domain